MQNDDSTIDKVDIDLLYFLYSQNKKTPMNSVQIKAIEEYYAYPISYYTVIRRVQKLLSKQYITEGYKVRNAKTYYLTSDGINFMENNIITEEVYDEEIDSNKNINNKLGDNYAKK